LICNIVWAQKHIQYVNPFIGTGGHGHTFPGATSPFGFCQLSPDTRIDGSWDGCSGYHYSDSIIYGFSHKHLSGTGVSDYGDILLMPMTRSTTLNHYEYKSAFFHLNELASPGSYSVYLDDPGVEVQLTASEHCGFHQYVYPEKAMQYMVLDLNHRDETLDTHFEIVDSQTVRGYRFSKAWASNQKLYFEMVFSKPFVETVYSDPDQNFANGADSNKRIVRFQFNNDDKELKVKVGLSAVDMKGARQNLKAEMKHWDFWKHKWKVEQSWEKELGKIDLKDLNYRKMRVFYTALYHCMIAPNIYSDVDGRYRGRDDKIHSTDSSFNYYSVFSLWDTYRTLHPLLTILDKKRSADFIKTFIKQYEQGGRLPIWELSANETNCMIGYHAIPVIWDAYSKGIEDFDVEKAYEAMKSIAMEDAPGLNSYRKYGYVRAEDDNESVSKTLEYAYDDWCIAKMAKALKKYEDYEYFIQRSKNWMNVYDPKTSFMRPKKNSTFIEPFSPFRVDNNYTEANAWQYSFNVPHDMKNLMKLHGGAEAFEENLDALFMAKTETEGREQSDISGMVGQYAHGNEPSHHIGYLYNLVSKPEKTQQVIDVIIDSFYSDAPDGLIGNEDCGQMSAWYVMSTLGLYPVAHYGFLYEDSKVKANPSSLIVDEMTDTVTVYDLKRIYKEIAESGDDELFENKYVQSAPYVSVGEKRFNGEQKVALSSLKGVYPVKIYYQLDGAESFKLYRGPFTLKSSTGLKFYAESVQDEIVLENYEPKDTIYHKHRSKIQEANFVKIKEGLKLDVRSEVHKSYTAGGSYALIDGVYGRENWRLGDWQGYQGTDFEVVIKRKAKQKLSSLSVRALQDQRAWIFLPESVQFYGSRDGENWKILGGVAVPEGLGDKNDKVEIETFELPIKPTNWPYIKVVLENYGKLPEWHLSAGKDAYIFIDEIELK